jgi:hypothetical protein
LGELKPGDIAKVQVLRNNKNIMLEIQLWFWERHEM